MLKTKKMEDKGNVTEQEKKRKIRSLGECDDKSCEEEKRQNISRDTCDRYE